MISFGATAMDELPDEEMHEVAAAARAVVEEIINAGVYVLAGGLGDRRAAIVDTDGSVSEGPEPEAIGGLTIVNVPTRQQALEWAAKIAAACRCGQEVWEIGHDPALEGMLKEAEERS
jgi:hypothetical protein